MGELGIRGLDIRGLDNHLKTMLYYLTFISLWVAFPITFPIT